MSHNRKSYRIRRRVSVVLAKGTGTDSSSKALEGTE